MRVSCSPETELWGEQETHTKGGENVMQFHIQTDKDKVIVLTEVAKIEVEDILAPKEGDDPE
jgi:hypothetical protein